MENLNDIVTRKWIDSGSIYCFHLKLPEPYARSSNSKTLNEDLEQLANESEAG